MGGKIPGQRSKSMVPLRSQKPELKNLFPDLSILKKLLTIETLI